jgi:hypothetical protein
VGIVAFAVAASSASALPAPYWAACVKVPKVEKKYDGKFLTKTCTTPEPKGEGKYELEESIGKGKPFKGGTAKAKKGEKLVALHVKNPVTGDSAKVECESGKDTGKPVLPNFEEEVAVTYKGCAAVGKACKTAGAKAGEIKITGVKGELGYVEEEPEVIVGLKLENEKEPGKLLAEFECQEKAGELVAKITGEVIGVQGKDVNTLSKESSLLDEATERYGEHEFEGKKFKPLVNILGWANELTGIEEAQMKNEEETDPAHVLKGEFCGSFVKGLLGKECIEAVYGGLDQTMTNKGETLMVKT